uniref:Uncharacterized protein n=1 Tax=Chromera velia CCMP2878 TaxID=1169474 RepID=A0A0G4GTJ8_9ALVE|eukprot:Cvel_23334.t1-p1 / transcript=Cvel_23334.t1 / gene=Cvel_23334 / organism=Chromera_velia_CCMP2878 / gene_product=hypothetical protein / transcript_product=hypothetical protein / location=Cvel_scaffold2391:18150-20626(+) / protein_length=146 / sequence_SO=supercontig / SO=protein_coding / is_pseudo=false
MIADVRRCHAEIFSNHVLAEDEVPEEVHRILSEEKRKREEGDANEDGQNGSHVCEEAELTLTAKQEFINELNDKMEGLQKTLKNVHGKVMKSLPPGFAGPSASKVAGGGPGSVGHGAGALPGPVSQGGPQVMPGPSEQRERGRLRA